MSETRRTRMSWLASLAMAWLAVIALSVAPAAAQQEQDADEGPWPPHLPGIHLDGRSVTLTGPQLLEIPEMVQQVAADPQATPFVIAKVPPRVELAFHSDLYRSGKTWSSWGEIVAASNGRVYVGIGDHGDDTGWRVGGVGNAYIYEWDPATSKLTRVVDLNAVSNRSGGEPLYTKVHARIEEGPDGHIYFIGTLNDGKRAATEERYRWSDTLPTAQLMRFRTDTRTAEVYANMPPARATASTILDRRHNRWWTMVEPGDSILAVDLSSGEHVLHVVQEGMVKQNRCMALGSNGVVYFNGVNGLWQVDPRTGEANDTGARLLPEGAIMRASTHETSDGYIYGSTQGAGGGQFFRFNPSTREVKMLGFNFLLGSAIRVCVLSPDERFIYMVPGGHGGGRNLGTALVQYHIASGQRKVIAFLRPIMEQQHQYIPDGTYGLAVSGDGRTVYINMNGHATPEHLPAHLKGRNTNEGIGFGLTSFVAVHIPDEELRDPTP